jgi:hypothetical protein
MSCRARLRGRARIGLAAGFEDLDDDHARRSRDIGGRDMIAPAWQPSPNSVSTASLSYDVAYHDKDDSHV